MICNTADVYQLKVFSKIFLTTTFFDPKCWHRSVCFKLLQLLLISNSITFWSCDYGIASKLFQYVCFVWWKSCYGFSMWLIYNYDRSKSRLKKNLDSWGPTVRSNYSYLKAKQSFENRLSDYKEVWISFQRYISSKPWQFLSLWQVRKIAVQSVFHHHGNLQSAE